MSKKNMDIKVKSKVFYPSHGAGWVRRQKEIEFGGEKKKYFEFELINNPITISTPIENIKELGIRPVLSGKEIRDLIRGLKKDLYRDPGTKDFNSLMKVIEEEEEKASVEGNIEIIKICNHVIRTRNKEGRLIPVTIEKQLDKAINDISGELAVSEGNSLEKAKATFRRITGLETPED